MLAFHYAALVSELGEEFDAGIQMPKIRSAARWLAGQGKPGLLLHGSYGTGKTTMLNAISRAMDELCGPYTSYLTTARRIIQGKTMWQGDDLNGKRLLLLVDEFGREQDEHNDYGNISEPVIDMICLRDRLRLPTVLASNCLEDEVKEKYGAYMHDRIWGNYSRIYYDNESYRR